MTEILPALGQVLSPGVLLVMAMGTLLGITLGAIPGLTPTMAVAVLVPFTFTMDPATGLVLLGAVYGGSVYGGSISAVLLNIPGAPANLATTWDGHPMAKRGEGARAIQLSVAASVIGGLIGFGALLFLAPPLARVYLAFGPPENFLLAVFVITIIASREYSGRTYPQIGVPDARVRTAATDIIGQFRNRDQTSRPLRVDQRVDGLAHMRRKAASNAIARHNGLP
jgi:TctA family transporter